MSSDKDRPLYNADGQSDWGPAALGATAAERVIPAYGAPGSAIDSYNWSGARVVQDVLPLLFPNSSKPQYFTSVKATWKVPKVNLHGSEAELRATWIGLDGGTWGLPSSKTMVLQAGIYHHIEPAIQPAKPVYTAFCGLDNGTYALGRTDLYKDFYQFPLQPSDTISVKLTYMRGSSTATADFTDTISANLPANPVISFSVDPAMITGYTVEWIFERVSKYNKTATDYDYTKSYHALGNHDAVVFSYAEAMTNNGDPVSPDDGDSINMRDVDSYPSLLAAGTALPGEVLIKQRYH